MINIIVAMDKNGGIGKDNKLLAHIPEDLKHFKDTTDGHTVVMGYSTWLSLPKKPLPNRRNIVLTTKDIELDGAVVIHSIDELKDWIDFDDEVFIIGGAKVYEQFLPYADRMYVTLIEDRFEADTFFPKNLHGYWRMENYKCLSDVKMNGDSKVDIMFATHVRCRK